MIIIITLVLIGGFFNGWMDHLSFHDTKYNPANTWKNKYKKGLIEYRSNPWYYLGLYKPKYVEAFPYSSTVLVAFTDRWHLYKLLCFASFRTALVLLANLSLLYSVVGWIFLWILQAIGFHIKYTIIK